MYWQWRSQLVLLGSIVHTLLLLSLHLSLETSLTTRTILNAQRLNSHLSDFELPIPVENKSAKWTIIFCTLDRDKNRQQLFRVRI